MNNKPLLILKFALITMFNFNCSKSSNTTDSSELIIIESPLLEENLVIQKIDSDGKINGSIKKSDIILLTRLKLNFDIGVRKADGCQLRYNYNVAENNILEGLENFSALQKLVVVFRNQLTEDLTGFENSDYYCSIDENQSPAIIEVENLENLEEFYFASHYQYYKGFGNLKLSNNPKLKKIGTANPYVGLKDYPQEEIILMDESNFTALNPSYETFEPYVGSDDVGEPKDIYSLMNAIRMNLEDLPELESLHLFQAELVEVSKSNCPNFKKVFTFEKRNFLGPSWWLLDTGLKDMEELYIDYQHYRPFPSENPKILDLKNLKDLKSLYYKFFDYDAFWSWQGGIAEYRYNAEVDIRNGFNITNDFRLTLDLRNIGMSYEREDAKRMNLCLDEDVTTEFLNNNIEIISRFGVEGYEVVTLNCH